LRFWPISGGCCRSACWRAGRCCSADNRRIGVYHSGVEAGCGKALLCSGKRRWRANPRGSCSRDRSWPRTGARDEVPMGVCWACRCKAVKRGRVFSVAGLGSDCVEAVVSLTQGTQRPDLAGASATGLVSELTKTPSQNCRRSAARAAGSDPPAWRCRFSDDHVIGPFYWCCERRRTSQAGSNCRGCRSVAAPLDGRFIINPRTGVLTPTSPFSTTRTPPIFGPCRCSRFYSCAARGAGHAQTGQPARKARHGAIVAQKRGISA